MLLKGREFFFLWLYQQKCPVTLEKNSKAYKLVSLLILLVICPPKFWKLYTLYDLFINTCIPHVTGVEAPIDINWQYIYRKPRVSSKGPAEGIKRKKPREKNTTFEKQQQQTEVPVPFASAQPYHSGNGSPEQLLAPFDQKAAGSHVWWLHSAVFFFSNESSLVNVLKFLPYVL